MMKLFLVLRDNFRFTGNLHKEAKYYERPISKSPYFRGGTVTLICALITGGFTAFRFWAAMPEQSRLYLVVALLCMLGVWGRTVADHARMRKRLRDAPPLPATSDELLREAAGGANFGPSVLYFVALFLIFGWAFTLAHFTSTLATQCPGTERVAAGDSTTARANLGHRSGK
jgi:hypothetical protein